MTIVHEEPVARACQRCGRTTTPRRGRSPRYCATCGQPLVPTNVMLDPRRRREDAPPAANAALLLAIFSLIPFIGTIFSVAAVYLGFAALSRIKSSEEMLSGAGKGRATAAIALGILTGVLWILTCRGL